MNATPFCVPRERVPARGLTLLALAAALVLGACASTAPRSAALPHVDIPTAWAGAATSATTPSLTDWWRRFDDPLLSEFVAQALQTNTSVTGAIAAVRQARAQRDIAAAGLGPTVGTSASAQRSRSGEQGTRNTIGVGLDASWEPDFFGANRSALDASSASAQASIASLGDVQVSVTAEVALSYITLRNAQARLAIAQSNLEAQQETLQLTLWRQQAGLVTSLEAEQARTAVEQLRAQLASLQTSIAQNRHALAVLTGQPPAALDQRLAVATPVPQASGELALNIPAETLRQRPDVRAAELQAAAALARVAQADAERKPSFRLSGSLGLNALTVGSLGGAPLAAALLASVSWPIFDGGAGKAQVDAQQAALQQVQSGYQAAVLTALKDVEDALVALRNDRERLLRLQAAAESANNAALLARQRYASGLVDFQVVLETQRSQLSAQDSVANAQADISADHVRLFKALGGGWNADTALADERAPNNNNAAAS